MASPAKTHRNALDTGAALHWYRIERVLGQGAFGITYLATDTNLHRPVAIKEYLPASLAVRQDDGAVVAHSDDMSDDYASGLRRFISEARTLAKFEHPCIVRVHNVFEANATAYMVMQYEDGDGLDRVLKTRGTLSEEEILSIVYPLLGGLETIHAHGFVHRDIKPANIFIRRDGSPVLLDFGSARDAMLGEARTLTNFVSPGYAPIEQYSGRSDQQGPWSDIYGLAATLYRAMTGRAPTDATDRSHALAQNTQDSYQSGAAEAKRAYSTALLCAVDHALAFRAQDRPQNVAEWRNELPPPLIASEATTQIAQTLELASAPSAGADIAPTISVTLPTEPLTPPASATRTEPLVSAAAAVATSAASSTTNSGLTFKQFLIAGAAMVLLAIGVGAWFGKNLGKERSVAPASTVAQASAVAIPEPTPVPGDNAATLPAGTAATPSSSATPALPPDPEVEKRERVANLLYAASSDLEALRLTSPAGNNAYEKYREVLTLQPDNAAARQGIDAIADRYVGLAWRDLQANNLARAAGYVQKAEQLAPGAPDVLAARQALDAKRAAQLAPATAAPLAPIAAPAPDRTSEFGKRFRSFVREQKKAQREAQKSRANQLLDRLGGAR